VFEAKSLLQKISQSLRGSIQLDVIRVFTSPLRRKPSSTLYTSNGLQHSKPGLPTDGRQRHHRKREREKPTYNKDTKSVKLRQLRSPRLIRRDPKVTKLDMQRL
jgi:hypothetical protein